MKKSALATALVAAALAAACAAKSPAKLSAAQLDDVTMMTFMLSESGYRCEVGLSDLDGNNILDLDLKYISGRSDLTVEERLVDTAQMMGFLMMGCGYDIDRLRIAMPETVYEADFKTVGNCAFADFDREDKDEEAQNECIRDAFGL